MRAVQELLEHGRMAIRPIYDATLARVIAGAGNAA
jgi:hypothetical protein